MNDRIPDELVDLLSSAPSQVDAALLCIASLGDAATIAEIRQRGINAGVPKMKDWNLSTVLARASKLVRNVGGDWKLTAAGKKRTAELGLSPVSHIIFQTDSLLLATVAKITDSDRRNFLEEAHKCFAAGLCRAAVVLSWVGAAWIIQHEILNNHLAAFNSAGATRYNKQKVVFKDIKTIEDFGRVTESELLQLAEDIGLLGKSIHKQLKDRLDFRNGCGHPNSMNVDLHSVASHIHFLCNNVYLRY